MSSNRLLTMNSLPDNSSAKCIALAGKEGLSFDFDFTLTVIVEHPLNVNKLLGKNQGVTLQSQGVQRHFHGIISAITQLNSLFPPLLAYDLKLTPQMSLLCLHKDCRNYQNQSVIDIVRFWFQYFGITDCDFSQLTQTYPPLDYIVQFNETSWDFIRRLLAQAGIFYYFTFMKNQHRIHFADSPSAYAHETAIWHFGEHLDTHVHQFEQHHEPSPINQHLIASNDKDINKILRHSVLYPGNSHHVMNNTEYPVNAHSPAEAESLAKLHMQQSQTFTEYCTASSNIAELKVNHGFCVNTGNKEKYLITSLHHDIKDDSELPTRTQHQRSSYRNSMIGIPYHQCFRPSAIPKPCITNIHTATVTGPGDEDLYCNDDGHIKVKFDWDRHSPTDASSSCWVRVCHDWASDEFGMEFIPRVGQEVLIQYENGDPDKPLVMGTVYNGTHMPPYSLPDNASHSGFKMHSLQSQSLAANEIRFEDTANKEKLVFNAKRDLLHQTERDHITTIGNHQHIEIDGNALQHIQQGFYQSTAKQKLVLQAGPSSIVIHPEGIDIKAPQVNFNENEAQSINSPQLATHWVQARLLKTTNEPIPNVPYLITHADGTHVRGKTDESGKTKKLDNLHPGTASIEFGEREKLVQELITQRKKLKAFLDGIVAQVKAKSTQQRAMLAKKHWWDKIYIYGKTFIEGTIHGADNVIRGSTHLIVAMFEDVGDVMALNYRIQNDIAIGDSQDLTKLYQEANQKAKKAIHNIESAYHKMNILYEDKKTTSILESFAKDYYHNMDGLMILKDVADFAGGFIPAIILAIIIKNPAALGAGISQDIITLSAKAQQVIEKIIEIINKLKMCKHLEDAPLGQVHDIYAGDTVFMKKKDQFAINAKKRKPEKPYYDVIAHGNTTHVLIETNGKSTLVEHNVLAKLIQSQPDYNGEDIRLLSCSTGKCYNGIAQNLANKLGVNVKAPSDLLWAEHDGRLGIGPSQRVFDPRTGGERLEPVQPYPGEWRLFKPNKPEE